MVLEQDKNHPLAAWLAVSFNNLIGGNRLSIDDIQRYANIAQTGELKGRKFTDPRENRSLLETPSSSSGSSIFHSIASFDDDQLSTL